MYCIWKNAVPLNYFLPEGEDARNGHHFRLVKHDNRLYVLKTKIVRRSLFEKLRIKSMRLNKERSLNRWLKIYKSDHPVARLYIEGLWAILISLPQIIKSIINES